jgi:hypothetical protein
MDLINDCCSICTTIRGGFFTASMMWKFDFASSKPFVRFEVTITWSRRDQLKVVLSL